MVALARTRRCVALLAFAVVLAFPSLASAQVHWDASVQLGGMKRFLVSRPTGTDDVGIGPVGQITAHLALLPLVHAGLYVGHDISPMPDPAAARNITFMGARGKVQLPMSGNLRAYGFLGFGFALVTQQGFDFPGFPYVSAGGGTVRKDATVDSAGGHFFEVPFGLGASYKLRKPWELCAELGARVGFAHSGSVYDELRGPQVKAPGEVDQNLTSAGIDRFALGLTVGVMLDL
jgi:hypothetical protein